MIRRGMTVLPVSTRINAPRQDRRFRHSALVCRAQRELDCWSRAVSPLSSLLRRALATGLGQPVAGGAVSTICPAK
jgi:hypothetical protein